MDRLPRELIDAILQQCIALGTRNQILNLRLVCRAFERHLKPYACGTLDVEFTRLSRASSLPRPQMDALQTVGYYCKNIYIDLMVLRDDMEVEFLNRIFARVPSMTDFCSALQGKYCMNEASFTETDYYQTIEDILFNCRGIERLRLNLPFQLVGRHCNAATMILANTLKAFASRPEEDSAELKTLVLENVTDIAVCHLWMNPVDVKNIMRVLQPLENLVLTLRRHEWEALRMGLFASCLWNIIEYAQNLSSLCLIGMEHDDRPPMGLKTTKFWQLEIENWKARSLPAPHDTLANLTCLELKRVEVKPEVLTLMAQCFGGSLEELYLNEVYLKTEQSRDWNQDSKKVLWVGLPNQRPAADCYWIAMALRVAMKRLRICRASFLAYDLYLRDEDAPQPDFDWVDPCGLARSVSQRFVEVVMGVRQPPERSSGNPVEYHPADPKQDDLAQALRSRPRALRVTEYDTNAYQTAVANSTSRWHKSIDGVFPNSNPGTLDELHYIAETACQGMNEIHRRRNDAGGTNTLAREYAAQNFHIPAWEDEHEQQDAT